MQAIEGVLPLLNEESKKIFITCHFKPDGDAIGSSLGLYHYFAQKGHQPVVVVPSSVPDSLLWMPGIENVFNFESEPKECEKHLKEADYIFCLDFNHLSRVRTMEDTLRAATQPKVLIDHHLHPEEEVFEYGISTPGKSSTCEMIYDFIRLDNGEDLISSEVMQCLYTGLVTDTGSFRFSTVAAGTHNMAADFINRGLDHSVIHDTVFDVWSEERMRFMGFVLLERMKIYPEQHLGIVWITIKDMNDYQVSPFDTDGIVNLPLSIDTVNCSILLIEVKNEIKLSFRSQGDVNVNVIASTYFEGGGHFNASGGTSKLSIEETINKIKKIFNINKD